MGTIPRTSLSGKRHAVHSVGESSKPGGGICGPVTTNQGFYVATLRAPGPWLGQWACITGQTVTVHNMDQFRTDYRKFPKLA